MTIRLPVRLLAVAATLAAVAVQAGHVPAHAAFPGKNGSIVYAGPGTGGFDLYVRDGLASLDLTASDNVQDIEPAYSADGSRIAWSRGYDIWTMDSGGNNAAALVVTGAVEGGPAFSPSGNRIVYNSDGELWMTSSTDGTTKHDLGVAGGAPSWSPDGRWIAYSRTVNQQGRVCIFKMHPDGTHRTNLSTSIGSQAEDLYPDWSPDGSRLVVAHRPTGAQAPSWIVVMRADGTHRSVKVKDSRANNFPAFAPSGTKIVFTRPTAGGGSTHLATVSSKGGAITVLTSGSGDNYEPSWQPI